MKKRSFGMAVLALVAGLGAASSAHADWTFSGSGSNAANGDPLANTSYTSGGISLNVSGVAAANGGTCSGTMGTSGASCSPAGFGSGATWTSQALTFYSGGGLAMSSDGNVSPNHALDNGPATNSSGYVTGVGNTEAVLLSFGSSVTLSSIVLGYVSGDADFSVFRYTGASAPTLGSVSTFTTDALGSVNTGWDLVGNYNGTSSSPQTDAINSGNLGSSWWLISAYNTGYGSTSANGGTVDQGDDFFKLLSVAGTACTSQTAGVCGPGGGGSQASVPEPASMALVGIALVGALRTTRRRRKTS